MIIAVYFSYVLPLVFLIVVTKGEAHKLIVFFAWGLTAALGVYGLTGLLDSHTTLELPIQLVVVIPAAEELLKIVPLLFLLLKGGRKLSFSLTRCALAAGIGFSILENYLYLSLVSADTAHTTTYVIMRSLTACLLHGSASALIGFGFQYMSTHRFVSVPLFVGTYLTATAVHGLYNLLGMTPRWAAAAFLIPVVFFTVELFGMNMFGVRPGRRVPRIQEGDHEATA